MTARRLGGIANWFRHAPGEGQLQEWRREHNCDDHHDYDRCEDGIADDTQSPSNPCKDQADFSAWHYAYADGEPPEQWTNSKPSVRFQIQIALLVMQVWRVATPRHLCDARSCPGCSAPSP